MVDRSSADIARSRATLSPVVSTVRARHSRVFPTSIPRTSIGKAGGMCVEDHKARSSRAWACRVTGSKVEVAQAATYALWIGVATTLERPDQVLALEIDGRPVSLLVLLKSEGWRV